MLESSRKMEVSSSVKNVVLVWERDYVVIREMRRMDRPKNFTFIDPEMLLACLWTMYVRLLKLDDFTLLIFID